MKRVHSSNFVYALRVRAARMSTGASATRGQGRGVSHAARRFLSRLNLRYFSTSNAALFCQRLDAATTRLRASLPAGTRSWGLARKVLNIFLREALYTTYLEKYSRIGRAEPFLEVPLDSITAGQLWKHAGRGVLPRWRGVKHLTKNESNKYQAFARTIAEQQGLCRVHLDVFWWGRRDE